jgi:hypothetical protein
VVVSAGGLVLKGLGGQRMNKKNKAEKSGEGLASWREAA